MCGKNPDHQQFVPVDQFKVEHLPPGYHDNDLVDLVRAMSDLTVRVLVNYTSDKRPEGYPFYNFRDRSYMRIGTGWLCGVYTSPDVYNQDIQICECKDCLNSPTVKMQFGHILIKTTAHMVFNDQEGALTECELFYDKSSGSHSRNEVVRLNYMSRVTSNITTDTCIMKFVTHDLDLLDRLGKMVALWEELQYSFAYKCLISNYEKKKKSPQAKSEIDAKRSLVIIVSHPHGCSKHVSVGYCTKIDEVGLGWTKYIYTTATCPGSSGANTLRLASDCTKLDGHHSHSEGCAAFNRSSYGVG